MHFAEPWTARGSRSADGPCLYASAVNSCRAGIDQYTSFQRWSARDRCGNCWQHWAFQRRVCSVFTFAEPMESLWAPILTAIDRGNCRQVSL